ncbi:hypothetical protein MS3_00001397 [Schistosoma haematobium]|uniref:Uncharacterized protein n=1 Tax=Schistosoma haematobium TaxID=6185 RepID=A0A922S687_SCHHA|nr:hypothetical protein MS3_00001397 [Schistosoma haematobium]KAH9595294.1 hypothetical protein MS3_00001397 [Schistosoma haematobium]
MEHRPPTSILQPTLSWAFLPSSIQFLFISLMSISISRSNVFFGLPLLLWPSGFHVRACLVAQLGAFLNVYPIHFQRFFFLISSSAGIWFVLSHSRLLIIVSGQRIRSILRRQLLINTCIFWMMAFVVLQVSAPYSRTVLTFVLKMLTFVLVDSCFEFQMFLSCKYAARASPIRVFTSASDAPCSSMMLPKYVKVFTSSKSSPSIVIGLVHSVLYRRILLFPLCILRPTAAETAATLVVFYFTCCCVCDRRARSSAKSRSSSCILAVQFLYAYRLFIHKQLSFDNIILFQLTELLNIYSFTV